MFTRQDLAPIREAHAARIATARRFDSRDGTPIGMPGSLTFLGCWLAHHGADMPMTDAEQWFGWDRSRYLDFLTGGGSSVRAEILADGERLAITILEAIVDGRDPVTARLRSARHPAASVASLIDQISGRRLAA